MQIILRAEHRTVTFRNKETYKENIKRIIEDGFFIKNEAEVAKYCEMCHE